MDDAFKSGSAEDYSWNEKAEERAKHIYEQEQKQVDIEYAKSKQKLNEMAGKAVDEFFRAQYENEQTKDKMGWQGGAALSADGETRFFQMQQASSMYTKEELQKYGYKSELSVARMHAELKQDALAQQFYQEAIQDATREAEITGYYISPEFKELLIQRDMSKDIINSDKDEITKDRARGVSSAIERYFDKLGFTKDKDGNYPGVETLQNKQAREQERSNRVNEELQKVSNNIAATSNNLSALNLREAQTARFEFNTREAIGSAHNNLATVLGLDPKLAAKHINYKGVDDKGVITFVYKDKEYSYQQNGQMAKPIGVKEIKTFDFVAAQKPAEVPKLKPIESFLPKTNLFGQ